MVFNDREVFLFTHEMEGREMHLRRKLVRTGFGFVSAVAVVTSVVTPIAAQQIKNQLTISKYSGTSAAESILSANEYTSEAIKNQSLIDPEQVVSIIIELKETSLSEKAISYSEDVSAFIASSRGKKLADKIKQQQTSVVDQLRSLLGDAVVDESLRTYSVVMNGLSVKTQYKQLEKIKALSGVSRAFVAQEYEAIEPSLIGSSEQISVQTAYNNGYKGEGQRIAIVDTGLDDTHEAFQTAPSIVEVNQNEVSRLMSEQSFNFETIDPEATVQSVYRSAKVPFAFDYADGDANARPESAAAVANVDHGTHVASTAAGYATNDEGAVTFEGVAPEAQLFVFKVFSDEGGGASDEVILSALDDAVLFHVDVINMSLGSPAGFSTDVDDTMNEVYQRISDSGSPRCLGGEQL